MHEILHVCFIIILLILLIFYIFNKCMIFCRNLTIDIEEQVNKIIHGLASNNESGEFGIKGLVDAFNIRVA